MQVGDIVTIHDGSYTAEFDKNTQRIVHTTPGLEPYYQWKVVAVGGQFPQDRRGYNPDRPNDIMLCGALDSTRILFIQSRFCDLVHPKVPKKPFIVKVPAGTEEVLIQVEQ